MARQVYSNGFIHVMADKCETCIFKPGNKMSLRPGRVKQMVEESIAEGAGITCHKTLYGQTDQRAVCRGFYDSYADQVQALQVAKRIGVIKEV